MEKTSFWRLTGITVLAWLCVIGFDFLLHASILAPLYANPHPFLLPPERAFVLIPVGYLSFLILVILVVWLRFDSRSPAGRRVLYLISNWVL
jgi:uncharacterized membrane protein